MRRKLSFFSSGLEEDKMKYVELLARSVIVAALALAGVAAKAQDGVTKTSIVLGQSVALTGPGSVLAVPFHQGAKLYFDLD